MQRVVHEKSDLIKEKNVDHTAQERRITVTMVIKIIATKDIQMVERYDPIKVKNVDHMDQEPDVLEVEKHLEEVCHNGFDFFR